MNELRIDHRIIAEIVEPGSRVLDLGCGSGELLDALIRTRQAKGQGIELKEQDIYRCVEKGLNVFHSDIETGLVGYQDQSFDYVILNNCMQETKKADYVLFEALRVGKRVIVGFPNFAHIRSRSTLFFKGTVPITKTLPYRWHDTPNLHFLSIKDFSEFCEQKDICVLKSVYLSSRRKIHFLPNLLATQAIFVIRK